MWVNLNSLKYNTRLAGHKPAVHKNHVSTVITHHEMFPAVS